MHPTFREGLLSGFNAVPMPSSTFVPSVLIILMKCCYRIQGYLLFDFIVPQSLVVGVSYFFSIQPLLP
jgi:hypothetical protein